MNQSAKNLLILILTLIIGSCFWVYSVQAQNNKLILEATKECDIQYAGDSCVIDLKLTNNSDEILGGEAVLHIDYQGVCGDGFFDGEGIEAQFSINGEDYLDFAGWENGTTTVSDFNITEGESWPKLKIETVPNLCPGKYTFTLALKGITEEEEYKTSPIAIGSGGVSIAGLIISNEKVSKIGTDNATITWDTNKKATSRVIYSSSEETYELDWKRPPNYGYSNSTPESDTPSNLNGVKENHTVYITDLQPSTTYYYRCVSHASPPTISREYTFITLAAKTDIGEEINGDDDGKVFGAGDDYQKIPDNNSAIISYPKRVIQKAEDFAREFIESFSAKDDKDEGEVKGEEDEKIEEKYEEEKEKLTDEEIFEEKSSFKIWWWLILLLLFLIIAGIIYYYRKKFLLFITKRK